MNRYFANEINGKIVFDDDVLNHLKNVLRLRVGEKIEVVIAGSLYECKITNFNPLTVEKEKKIEEKREINNKIRLFYVPGKGEKLALVLQKCTELGVNDFVLVESKRSVIRLSDFDFTKKRKRIEKIVKEACMQSKRLVIPQVIDFVLMKDLGKYLQDINFVCYEDEAGETTSLFSSLCDINQESISFLVGPEGGFEVKEIEQIKEIGFIPVSLGNRILRNETAAIEAVGVASFILER